MLYCNFANYANKLVTAFTFWAQATKCSKHDNRTRWTVMYAGCKCMSEVQSANLSDSWALVL